MKEIHDPPWGEDELKKTINSIDCVFMDKLDLIIRFKEGADVELARRGLLICIVDTNSYKEFCHEPINFLSRKKVNGMELVLDFSLVNFFGEISMIKIFRVEKLECGADVLSKVFSLEKK